MKAILYAISIALIAAGVAVGLMVLTNAANVVIGLTLETAAILITGGFVVLGLASVTAALFGVVDAIEAARRPAPAAAAHEVERPYIPPAAAPPAAVPAVAAPAVAAAGAAAAGAAAWGTAAGARAGEAAEAEQPLSWRNAGYTTPAYERPADDADAAPAEESAAEPESAEDVEPAADAVEVIEETVVLASPDHADDLVERAYEASEVLDSEEPPPAEEEDVLYVVEEKVVRGLAARILSDGTVEAETEEGWMRFENMEHLEEYLDATAAA